MLFDFSDHNIGLVLLLQASVKVLPLPVAEDELCRLFLFAMLFACISGFYKVLILIN